MIARCALDQGRNSSSPGYRAGSGGLASVQAMRQATETYMSHGLLLGAAVREQAGVCCAALQWNAPVSDQLVANALQGIADHLWATSIFIKVSLAPSRKSLAHCHAHVLQARCLVQLLHRTPTGRVTSCFRATSTCSDRRCCWLKAKSGALGGPVKACGPTLGLGGGSVRMGW